MGISVSLSSIPRVQPAVDHMDVNRLINTLTLERDAGRRAAILDALVQQGTREAAYGLTVFLLGADATANADVVAALARMPDAVAPFVSQMLRSANTDVRMFALGVLSDLRHPQAVDWLCMLLEADPDCDVVACALDVALEVCVPAMEQALITVQNRFSDDPYIGFVSALLLDRIDHNRRTVFG